MKNKIQLFKTLAITITISSLISCDKEKKEVSNEQELVKEIKASAMTNNLTREEFAKNIYPYADSLHSVDSVKYGLIYHIAKKTANEPNPEIYKNNLKDFQGEMNILK